MGMKWTLPSERSQKILGELIYDSVKAGKDVDTDRFYSVVGELEGNGADAMILGCTELSVINRSLEHDPRLVDSTEALAYYAIGLWRENSDRLSVRVFDLEARIRKTLPVMRANSHERNFQMKLSDIIKNVPLRSAATANAKYRGSSLTHPCAATVLCSSASAAHAPTVTSTPPMHIRAAAVHFSVITGLTSAMACARSCAPDTRAALASVSAEFYGNPAKKLRIIGITGTKGKTTTSLMTAAILNGAGIPCAYIGSNGVMIKDRHIDTVNTTPESLELHHYFRLMADAGVDTVAMEVSSQALAHHRVDGIDFEVTAFLNLSEDHIGEGEHPDFEDYKNSKKRLFSEHKTHLAVYNADDPCSEEMISTCSAPKIAFSVGRRC